MSSTSPDSEMGFDSEEREIYYIAEVETEGIDESRLSISQTSSDDDQADLYADDPLSNEEWTVEYQKEVDADKELERTLNGQTRRQYRSQRIVRMQRVARVYYFRAFFDLALKYTFCINTQVRWLSRII